MQRKYLDWLWHSSIFWLGLVITVLLIWLLIDGFRYTTAYSPIHRGSWRDNSRVSAISGGTPSESLVVGIIRGAVEVRWLDELNPIAGDWGGMQRDRIEGSGQITWLPGYHDQRNSLCHNRSVAIPTWLILASWLCFWAWALRKSHRKFRRSMMV